MSEEIWRMLDDSPLPEWAERLKKLDEEAQRAIHRTEWRDISTAPKDGTPIVMIFGNMVCIASWGEEEIWGGNEQSTYGEGWWRIMNHDLMKWESALKPSIPEPSHWMPLPHPPEKK